MGRRRLGFPLGRTDRGCHGSSGQTCTDEETSYPEYTKVSFGAGAGTSDKGRTRENLTIAALGERHWP
jgi:hypothetical protein